MALIVAAFTLSRTSTIATAARKKTRPVAADTMAATKLLRAWESTLS
jgi:hypothetical protein